MTEDFLDPSKVNFKKQIYRQIIQTTNIVLVEKPIKSFNLYLHGSPKCPECECGSRPRSKRLEWRERDGGEERDRGLRDRRYHTQWDAGPRDRNTE